MNKLLKKRAVKFPIKRTPQLDQLAADNKRLILHIRKHIKRALRNGRIIEIKNGNNYSFITLNEDALVKGELFKAGTPLTEAQFRRDSFRELEEEFKNLTLLTEGPLRYVLNRMTGVHKRHNSTSIFEPKKFNLSTRKKIKIDKKNKKLIIKDLRAEILEIEINPICDYQWKYFNYLDENKEYAGYFIFNEDNIAITMDIEYYAAYEPQGWIGTDMNTADKNFIVCTDNIKEWGGNTFQRNETLKSLKSDAAIERYILKNIVNPLIAHAQKNKLAIDIDSAKPKNIPFGHELQNLLVRSCQNKEMPFLRHKCNHTSCISPSRKVWCPPTSRDRESNIFTDPVDKKQFDGDFVGANSNKLYGEFLWSLGYAGDLEMGGNKSKQEHQEALRKIEKKFKVPNKTQRKLKTQAHKKVFNTKRANLKKQARKNKNVSAQ